MPSKIVWLRGTQIGQEFELGDALLSLGRSPENSVPVGSGRASRHHAEIRADSGGYVLVDLDSANGVLVNGQRIVEPYRLRAGDLFEIGDELFRYDAGAPVWTSTLPPQPAPPVPQPPLPKPDVDTAAAPGSAVSTPPVSRLPSTTPTSTAPERRFPRWILLVILVVVVLLIAAIGFSVLSRSGGAIRPAQFSSNPTIGQLALAAPASGDVAQMADWTVLVYLAGDNNLEADALRDLNEMEQAGSNDRVQLVVQFDRTGQAGDGERWSGARRYLVQRDADPLQISSPTLANLERLNMGDPQVLADFVVWGVRQYPARHHALVIWDHGSAWAGTAFDASAGGDGLNLLELEQALGTAQTQLDGMRFDLIGFDACLMGQLDVLLAVQPYGRVAVASAELEPNDGWDWAALTERLQAEPTMDGAGLGRVIVETYGAAYESRNERTATLAAFDLELLRDVVTRTGAFADALTADLGNAYTSVAEARSYATVYSQPRPEEFSAVDLGDLARLTIERGAPEAVAAPARELVAAIERARIAMWSGPFHADASGLSVFFPQAAERMPGIYDQLSPLARQTSWARFVRTFLAAGASRVAVPQITELRAALDSTNTITLDGSVAGREIANVFFFVGIPNSDRTGVQLIDIDYVTPPGSADAPVWDGSLHPLHNSWAIQQWGLDNGSTQIRVLLGPARYGSDLYGVEGLYQGQGGNPPIDAALLFRMQDGQATLQSVYGFPRGQGREAQPLEIQPLAGDRFTAQMRTYTTSAARLVPGRVSGETITFGDAPLRAVRLPAAAGDYVAGFLVRDISGRFSYQYRDIRVTGS